jgi:peptide-methionine (S)-S-oxide reductase
MENKHFEKAIFGAGCFWGIEEVFRTTPGVVETSVGFMGGELENPTYTQVCSGTTGHAEVVQIIFDPEKISYDQLLDIFWKSHDPTQFNRQGSDIGVQYRSVIFYYSEEQKNTALQSLKKETQNAGYAKSIMTAIDPVSEFYRAEEYHQKYFLKNGGTGVCNIY